MKIVSVLTDGTREFGDCDLIEVRADCLSEFPKQLPKPFILTLRSVDQGGKYSGSEKRRLDEVMQLAHHGPAYVDLEHTVPNDFLQQFHAKFPGVKIIRSYHNYNETPKNLEKILASMRHESCSIYKFATTANTSLDNLRMLRFIKDNNNIVGHCMGDIGTPSRILGVVMGNELHYAGTAAPGSLSLEECHEVYRIRQLNKETKIYALLGDPVEYSIGHVYHNKRFFELGVNAVYVKFRVVSSELDKFFKNIKGLPFKGFSVTMPLKNAAAQLVDTDDESVNTVMVTNGRLIGVNTDGPGALDAIEKIKLVKGASVLILGAGGAAQAITKEARKRGAQKMTIANRTLKKAQKIAQAFGAEACTLSVKNFHKYDIIISCLPPGIVDTLQLADNIDEDTCYMDINYAMPSMPSTINKNRVIQGVTMFNNQARLQTQCWLNPTDPSLSDGLNSPKLSFIER